MIGSDATRLISAALEGTRSGKLHWALAVSQPATLVAALAGGLILQLMETVLGDEYAIELRRGDVPVLRASNRDASSTDTQAVVDLMNLWEDARAAVTDDSMRDRTVKEALDQLQALTGT